MAGAAGNRRIDYLGSAERRTIETHAIGRGVIGVTRVRSPFATGHTDPPVIEDAFMVTLQLERMWADLFLDGRHVPVPGRSDERITLYDLRREWSADIQSGFDSLYFHVPRAVLDGLEEDLRKGRIDTLHAAPGDSIHDPVVLGLGMALLPAFERPEAASTLFVDHVGWAFADHVARTYCGADLVRRAGTRLGPWQEKRVKDMIEARLDGQIQLAELALACGMSPGHFSRAFRRTTGVPPHRWLLRRRVDRACGLLLRSDLTLAEIGGRCGFYDQSHFTRVFEKALGMTPGAWRRLRRG